MQSPKKTPLTDFSHAYTAMAALNECPLCAGRLALAECFVSFHAIEFGDACAGEGKCQPVLIPFCPACEPVPDSKGCVHTEVFNIPQRFKAHLQ